MPLTIGVSYLEMAKCCVGWCMCFPRKEDARSTARENGGAEPSVGELVGRSSYLGTLKLAHTESWS
jgi:hypothetical protein